MDIHTDIYGRKSVKTCPGTVLREDGGFEVMPEIAGKWPGGMVL